MRSVPVTAADRPRSEALRRRAAAVMPGGNTRTTVFVPPAPPFAASAQGCHVVDADGHRLIDLQANYTSLVHGHGHPAITKAATNAMAELASAGLPTAVEVELAEHLVSRVPNLEQVRFTNSGTEAVMMAIRAARAATGRDLVVVFDGCYHGSYDLVAPPESPGISAATRAGRRSIPYGDGEALAALCEAEGDRIACVLLDLMPNRAGLRPADPEFASLVRHATRRHGIVLVLDEIITFRLEHGGLGAEYGLEPDLVTLGKLIGGGFPVGAFGGRATVMGMFDPARPDAVGHGGTFNANPVTMRAGLAALELLTPHEIARINRLGDSLRARLRGLGYDVAGRGSLLRVVEPGRQHELWWRLYEQGVLIGTNGLSCVTTPIDEDTIGAVHERFARVRRSW